MKKGLLSLLVLALTVVGCQNYDDQFEELTSLIEDLQTDVQGIDGVSSKLRSFNHSSRSFQPLFNQTCSIYC